MHKLKVLIIFGGCSSEYEVSLQSAYSVIKNLNKQRYETILIGITREGNWVRYYGDVERIPLNTWNAEMEYCIPVAISPDRGTHKILEYYNKAVMETAFDIAFPILHGKNGEDGTVQGLLEVAGIPSVGCGTLSSALCMDKDRAHKLVELEGIKVPASASFTKEDTMENIRIQTRRLIYPLFVKPVKSGSSLGITKIEQENQLEEAVTIAFLHDNQIVVEENIDGFEVGCAVLGNDKLTIGEIDEIELSEGFFDYYEKYNLKSSKIHMPARIDTEISRKIKEAAASIYRVLGCKGFARVDLFLTPEKELVFNEVNTIPGFTSHSRYPNMMKGIGLEFPDVLDKLIQMGLD